MTNDPTPLALAAQQRAEDTRLRAIAALRRLDSAGETINFTSVARQAAVSRSWLYRQADLKAEINRLRSTNPTPTATLPAVQRASPESLRHRLDAAHDEIDRLKTENRELREEVARHLGQ